MQYEMNTFNYFDTLVRFLRAQPINLAGIAAPSGGQSGGPGYIGYLPQTRVAYDETEAATQETAVSGSLLDNLNHIRYQITTLSGIAAGGVIIEEDGVVVASGVTVIDFIEDFEILEEASNQVTVSLAALDDTVTLSGVHGEDLSGQISGDTTHFDTNDEFYPGFLRVYYNGLRQDAGITEDSPPDGFTTDFTVVDGDAIVVDYDVAVSGGGGYLGHGHGQYVTYTFLESNYYDNDAIDDILANKADSIHTHVEGDITDLSHNAIALQGIPISGMIPADETVLQYSASEGIWVPQALSGVLAKTIHQQVMFSVEGEYMAAAYEGVKPLKAYVHEVGYDGQFEEVFVSVGTPPASGAMHIDVMKNGTSIFNTPEYLILAQGSGYATRGDFAITQVSKDDYLQFELVQGDPVASDLTVHVRFKWEA